MIYYAHITQVMSGCDSSIGCGQMIIRLKSVDQEITIPLDEVDRWMDESM